jgi:hypothetical protein
MKANFGLLPPLSPPVRRKQDRYQAYADRSLQVLQEWALDFRVVSMADTENSKENGIFSIKEQ